MRTVPAAALLLLAGGIVPAAAPPPITIVLLGPPGAGKSTQAAKLASAHGYVVVATGDLLRAESARKTPLGATIAEQLARGALVPNEIVDTLVRQRLAASDCSRGVVFDGYPRNRAQARALDRTLAQHGLSPPIVLDLDASDDVLVARLARRGRADDERSVIARRLATYRAETVPVAAYYRGPRYHAIAADASTDAVFAAIEAALSAHAARK